MLELDQELVGKIARKTLEYMVENGIALTPENYFDWYSVFHYLERSGAGISPEEAYKRVKKDYLDAFEIGNFVKEFKKEVDSLLNDFEDLKTVYDATKKALMMRSNLQYADPYAVFMTKKLGIVDSIFERMVRKVEDLRYFSEKLNFGVEEFVSEFVLDPLTGVYTRKVFFYFLKKAFDTSKRVSDYKFYLIILDLDDFKRINDEYGHEAGDKVLKTVGKTLKNTLRDMDVVGRIGGEEFGVILDFCSGSKACKVAERIRKEISSAPIRIKGKDIYVTASLGLASSEKASSLKELYSLADFYMYKAKKSGKNKSVCSV